MSSSNQRVQILHAGDDKRIVFCLPGNHFSMTFIKCWSNLLSACIDRNYCVMLSTGNGFDALTSRSECLCVDPYTCGSIGDKPFDNIDYEYIMWIDHDQVFTASDVFNLLESPYEATCGSYSKLDGELVVWHEVLGKMKWMSHNEKMQHEKTSKDPYMHVEYAGMGFFLLKQGVLERLRSPWFFHDNQTRNITNGERITSGEDIAFCDKLARLLDIKIMLDTRVHVGHEKSTVIW